jgi:crotonobetainyl-CoA:carnitine CoA-transferase CaiB-like acyl-CoA transferase
MEQALDGVRVVELSAGMAGPWIGRFMAYCGAEVIKIESRDYPDVTRLYVAPRNPELGIQPQLSPWFTDWNAGKRFVALDLTRKDGVALAKRLVAHADVVVENYSAGVADKLGLGYATLREVRPDLVMLGSSGYGATGPCRSYVTWGPNIEALAGLATLSGFPERDCTITQYAYPDALSAVHGLVAVMAALDHRLRTGRGQYIDLSQFEVTASAIGHVLLEHLASGREPKRRGNRARHAAPHGCYRCQGEDRWCAIVIASDADWERFCRVTGHPEWQSDPRFADLTSRLANVDLLDTLVEGWTSARNDYEVMETLQAAGIAAGVVQNVEDQARRDPQLAARGFFEEIAHVKKGTAVATGIPLGLTGTPGRTGRAGAAVGEDTDYVFGEVLGMPADEIRRLVAAGIIQTQDPRDEPDKGESTDGSR